MLSAWGAWAILAAFLAAAELLLPAQILLGFAIGAAAIAVQIWLGIIGGSVGWTLTVFAVLSLAAWIALRQLSGTRDGQIRLWDRDINDD
ncbi:hypothetical protein PARPLA_00831 [Rhodobacteraceae bacterium THAF1]|uniref:hypothetical protein n=1 Tax=Palleronia sp. THAF1 TaxID=2587842 RepID=UPI000F3B48E7|nr:hypothetical protein [Palleronia sp. THAF1]QFU09610.1 hypothetical protein FIU81_13100 [Palleronia sp. THAF1]VDC17489.1 hypothetical protein PARPLA_00831 [Rhodobacteraceae bacterium THAF1]